MKTIRMPILIYRSSNYISHASFILNIKLTFANKRLNKAVQILRKFKRQTMVMDIPHHGVHSYNVTK
jgi:hypothetical protein